MNLALPSCIKKKKKGCGITGIQNIETLILIFSKKLLYAMERI